jgi:hypothetical protein
MSSKKPHGPTTRDPDAPRPVAFLFAVIVAAGVSTWYWYRPLPQRAAELNHGAFATQPTEVPDHASLPKSKWKDAGLVFPSDDPLTQNPLPLPNSTADGSEADQLQALTGSQDLALQRFQEKSQPLKDWVHREPLPMVPVTGADSLTAQALPKPKLWTNALASPSAPQEPSSLIANKPNSGSTADPDAPSPFRVPRIDSPARSSHSSLATAPSIWPDQGFDPSRPPLAPPVVNLPTHGSLATGANSIPSQAEPMDGLTTSSSQRIRTMDREPDKTLPPPMQAFPSNIPQSIPKASAPRGTVIRQPPPKSIPGN